MKYWLLTTEYPPQFGGGISTYCIQLCSLLKKNGVNVTVFVPNKRRKNFKESMQDGIRIVEFSPFLKNTSDFFGYETMISSSFEEIVRLYIEREGLPDWLEAQEYQGIAYFILQKKHLGLGKYENLKILITCHCPSFITFEHNHINTFQLPYYWIGEMEKFCMRSADICVFPSQYLANEILAKYPGLINRYYVLHNPYLIEATPLTNNRRNSNDILVIGKLSPAKGVFATLRLFNKLWQNNFKYKLKLIGDEDYFYQAINSTSGSYIKKKYSQYIQSGLLTTLGLITPEKVNEEIFKAKIILVPSKIENLPYSVIESMAKGKIVIASSNGGQKELIQDGINGFIFDYNDAISFEKKIELAFGLNTNQENTIAAEAINTIKEKCDPQTYYENKLKLLSNHNAVPQNDFPFVRSISGDNKIEKEENNDLLSVVIPFFNMGKYIQDTISSIKNSSYKNLEIILVNDGSTDIKSLNALEELKKENDIKIINQVNIGLSGARNIGALEANGKYLTFLDSDDKVATSYYEKAIKILKQKANVYFVGSWVQYFGNSNNKWPTFNPEPPFLLYHNMVNSSSLVYKKNAFLKYGLNDSRFLYGMEDYDSVINLVKNGYRGLVIPEFLFFYRVRNGSITKGFNKSNIGYLYQLLANKHAPFYTNFATEIFNLVNINGPAYVIDNPTLDYHLINEIGMGRKMSTTLIKLIKRNPVIRTVAYKFYKILKNRL